MTTLICWSCGVEHAIPVAIWDKSLRKVEGHGWYCPNGHRAVAMGEAEEIQLRRLLASARCDIDRLQTRNAALWRSNAALRGVITRMKRVRAEA